jgi:ZIP family zinc transporter
MDGHNFWFALALTSFAGLSTGIGSFIALWASKTNTKLLSFSLGFSAGVMIYISFMEMLPEAFNLLEFEHGKIGNWYSLMAFFGGILIILLIDWMVPNSENPHEMRLVEQMNEDEIKKRNLKRMGIMSALAISIHNFPEGIATFISSYSAPDLGLPIAIAVAIHNIPEGIAVAVPIFYATNSRKKAFKYSFLSGLSEPLGALLAFWILMPFLSDTLMGVLFAAVAGIMVYISVDELLPGAEKYGEHHLSAYGIIAGMALMAVSLLLL